MHLSLKQFKPCNLYCKALDYAVHESSPAKLTNISARTLHSRVSETNIKAVSALMKKKAKALHISIKKHSSESSHYQARLSKFYGVVTCDRVDVGDT